MIIIKQGSRKTYINSEYVKSVSYNKDDKEAKVLYTDNQEIRYFHVDALDFKERKL